jgi:hypothetical protein
VPASSQALVHPWSDGVDWDRVVPADITPGETVGAYER